VGKAEGGRLKRRARPGGGRHAGRAPVARPASNIELHTHHFGDELSTGPKKTKTYGRFLGMIFFGGFLAPLVPGAQRVEKEKNMKK
jgi:hypothetical protein